MPAKKKTSSGSGPKSKRIVKNKMQKVMHEYKHHELSSGRGGKVRNPKQAIAIGLSEARRSGADIPPDPNQRKRAAKKGATKKKATTKKTTKKAAGKKTAAKKTTSRKTTKRAAAKKKR
ncbi:MAG: histone H1-like protein [Acidobacteriaceae bacterium]|nr:histone H1-like protein [Acidobacteriaceae bacterium]